MGWNEPVEVTPIVIVGGSTPGSGVFIYNGTPGAGNLIESHTPGVPVTSTDAFGNGTVGGDAMYYKVSGVYYASVRLGETIVSTWSASSAAGPYTEINTWGMMTVVPFEQAIEVIGSFIVNGGPINATAGTASNPSIITTDTWHAISLATGFSSTDAEYKLNADNTVSLRGIVNLTANEPAFTAWGTLPAPTANLFISTPNNLSGYALGGVSIVINADGFPQIGVAATNGNFFYLDGVRYHLD